MSVQISYKKQFLLYFALILIFLGVVEGIARIYEFFNPTCNMIDNVVAKNMSYDLKVKICEFWVFHLWYIDPLTGLKTSEPNQHLPTLNINSHGFRGPEISMEKPYSSFRIFVVGGSTTFAPRAISDQHTIPGYLQKYLERENLSKNVEVINAGIPAFVSGDELVVVKNKILKFSPDLIIIYDGVNDINLPLGWRKTFMADVDFFDYTYKKYFSFFKTPSIIVPKKPVLRDPVLQDPVYFNNTINVKKVELWKDNIKEICSLGKHENFETLVVLQPFLGTGNKKLTEQERKIYDQLDRGDYVKGYEIFANELNDLSNYCLGTEDLRNIFDGIDDTVYYDQNHIGDKYNQMVAEKIFNLIRQNFGKN